MKNPALRGFYPVPDFPGYEVNREGVVRRTVDNANNRYKAGRLVRPFGSKQFAGRGYMLSRNKKRHYRSAYELIATVFCLNKADLHDHPRGERNHAAKLIAEDIPQIRALQGKMAAYKVARLFGVTRSPIVQIWKGNTWRHIP